MPKIEELKPCPFCGKDISIALSDSEGNMRPASYEEDPWSGISFQILHDYEQSPDCPIAAHPGEPVGTTLYDTREELIEKWNVRK